MGATAHDCKCTRDIKSKEAESTEFLGLLVISWRHHLRFYLGAAERRLNFQS
jgi:hypothetical protein